MDKMRRAVCALATAALMLAGCSANNESQVNVTEAAPEASEPVALTLFSPADDTASSARYFRDLIDQFNVENPDVQVTLDGVATADGYNEYLEERLDSGEGDDAFIVNADSVKPLYAKGHFYDMRSFTVFEDLNDAARVQACVGDIAYCIPVSMNPYGMGVNLDVLEAHHLAVPTNLSEFMSCCEKLAAAGVTPIALNRWYALTVPAMANGLYRVYGSKDADAIVEGLNDGTVAIGDYMIEGFSVVEEFIDNGWYGEELTTEAVDKIKAGEQDVPAFAAGQCAFIFFPVMSYEKVLAQNPDVNLFVTGVPVPDGMVSLPALGSRLCVNANGKHLEETRELVEYVTSRQRDAGLVGDDCTFPVFKGQQASVDDRLRGLAEVYESRPQVPIEDMALSFTYWDTVRELAIAMFDGESAQEAAEAYNAIQAQAVGA